MKRLNILELHRTINEKNMRKTEIYEKYKLFYFGFYIF
jgi:hypothetical protein